MSFWNSDKVLFRSIYTSLCTCALRTPLPAFVKMVFTPKCYVKERRTRPPYAGPVRWLRDPPLDARFAVKWIFRNLSGNSFLWKASGISQNLSGNFERDFTRLKNRCWEITRPSWQNAEKIWEIPEKFPRISERFREKFWTRSVGPIPQDNGHTLYELVRVLGDRGGIALPFRV